MNSSGTPSRPSTTAEIKPRPVFAGRTVIDGRRRAFGKRGNDAGDRNLRLLDDQEVTIRQCHRAGQCRVNGQRPIKKRQVVIDGGAISKLPAAIDTHFARRAKIDDRTHPEFIDDAISPLGGQAMQGIAAK